MIEKHQTKTMLTFVALATIALVGISLQSANAAVNLSFGGGDFPGPWTLDAGGNTFTCNGAFGSPTNLNGVISGPGDLTLTNANANNDVRITNLNAQSTYAGNTTVISNNARHGYRIGIDNALPATTVLRLIGSDQGSDRPVWFDLNGYSQEVAGIANNNNSGSTSSAIVNGDAGNDGILIINNSANQTYTAYLGADKAHGNITQGTPGNSATGIPDGEGNNFSLVKNNAGTLTLSNGGNSYTGGTTINGGTLKITGGSGAGETSSALGLRDSGNVITVNNGGVLWGTTNNWLAAANPGADTHTLIINAGGLVQNSNSVTGIGDLTLNGGTLEAGTGWNSWNAAYVLHGDVTAGGNTTSYITTTSDSTANVRLTSANGDRTFTVGDGSTLEVSAKLLNGNGFTSGLIKDGNGQLKLTNNNSYTGGTTVTEGGIILGNKNGFGTGTVTLADGVDFRQQNFEGNSAGGALPNDFVLSGGMVNVNVAFGGAKDIWINQGVSGSGGFNISGSGRTQGLTLSGANTFTGGVTVNNNAPVSIDNNASLGTGTLRSQNGILRITENVDNVANPVVIGSGQNLRVRVLSGKTGTLAGGISDEGTGGNLVKTDPGTLQLAGTNTYIGDTTVEQGILTLVDDAQLMFDIGPSGVNNQINGAGTVNLDGDFNFDLTDASTTIGDLWQIVDTSGGLTANYGDTFSVVGFSDADGNLWDLELNGINYQFDEQTGILSALEIAPVPEPSTFALAVLSLLSMVAFARRRKR